MSLLKKSAPPAEFRVQSLAEADAEYRALSDKHIELSQELAQISREASALEADMRARPAPNIRVGVAALLGESVDTSLMERPQKLRELRTRAADLEAAVEIIRRRLADRRGIASVAACKLVKEEYARRIAAFVSALDVAKAAYDAAEEVIDGLEREDVQVGYIQPTRSPFFAGKENGMSRLVADARSAGHV